MSLLSPGGRRNADGVASVFGYEAIKRLLQKRGRSYRFSGSIAKGNRNIRRIGPPHDFAPHEHKRATGRRAHQQRNVNA